MEKSGKAISATGEVVPKEVLTFAEGLRQEVFTGSTGRVFPKAMKASPLLRSWLARFENLKVILLLQHRWMGPITSSQTHIFATPIGDVKIHAKALILAMGGASWARLGPDGA